MSSNQVLMYIAMILFCAVMCAITDHPVLGGFIFIIGLASIKMS